jgi:hypothetical protein
MMRPIRRAKSVAFRATGSGTSVVVCRAEVEFELFGADAQDEAATRCFGMAKMPDSIAT